jgi:signal transduction histidine kinase
MTNIQPINILIVDDNQNNLFTLHSLLQQYFQLQILEATSGAQALKILALTPIDLIILDVQMPDMDGFEMAQAVRSRKKTQHIPIVFLTAAYKAEEFKQRGFAVGAADYLTKPIESQQLISRIQIYVRFVEQDRQHKQELEHKVQARTEELSNANQSLEQEITERKQIEAQLNQEIEEREQIEQALQEAKDTSEAANLAKSQFLANMSHELRTPLNAIIGYSEMLQEDLEDTGQTTSLPDLHKIHSAGNHLLGLINDVLDLSKIEAGKMDLFLERVDLEILLDEVISTAQPLIAKKANVLEIERSDTLGEMHTDMTKLRQMLLNLLSNAAKFTENGIICLNVKRDDALNQFIFCVADNGIGMTEEQQQKLFQPFIQADASTTRRYGGSGLGLTITKQFAEMMGGTIQLNSQFGIGSTFTLTLPIQAQVVDVPPSKPEPQPLEGDGIILLIDDDAQVRRSFKNDLSKLGYAVALAADGLEGIKLANKLRPDAIILDVQMPDMDGWRILSMLHSDPLLARIPVIMIAMEADKEQGYAMGATECLDKIMAKNQLPAILEKYHIRNNSSDLIMVVDDDTYYRASITAIIEKQGWRVFEAENGQVALEHLERKNPALILLDLNMPVMDGFEFLAQFQKNDIRHSTPVIVLTSKNLTAEELANLNQHVETIYQKEVCQQDKLILQIHQYIADSASPEDNDTKKQYQRWEYRALTANPEKVVPKKDYTAI